MTETKGVIDRFEGEVALIETEQGIIQIAQSKLPEGLKEGDCVIIDGEQVTVDHEQTARRKAAMEQRLKSLFGK
ncbi:MAG: DUF3006 domain-containing protein [Bacillota bacterium]